MNFEIFDRRSVDADQFVNFWAKFWSAKDQKQDQEFYDKQIKEPLTEENLRRLFRWKNQIDFANHDSKSKAMNRIISRLEELRELSPTTTAESFLTQFDDLSAIWRIFLLHCWSKGKYPIYDQHVHRAMSFICLGKMEEIGTWSDKRKACSYLKRYLPFSKNLGVANTQKVDQALMVFGRFLKTYSI